jgi:hypothetical protein
LSETTLQEIPYAEKHAIHDGGDAVICAFDVRAIVQPEPSNTEFRHCGAEQQQFDQLD